MRVWMSRMVFLAARLGSGNSSSLSNLHAHDGSQSLTGYWRSKAFAMMSRRHGMVLQFRSDMRHLKSKTRMLTVDHAACLLAFPILFWRGMYLNGIAIQHGAHWPAESNGGTRRAPLEYGLHLKLQYRAEQSWVSAGAGMPRLQCRKGMPAAKDSYQQAVIPQPGHARLLTASLGSVKVCVWGGGGQGI